MYLLLGIVAAVAIWQLLVRTRINTWVILIGAIVIHGSAGALLGGTASTLEILAAFGAMFLAFTLASAIRTIESGEPDLDDLRTDPATIRDDGIAVADRLHALGFESAPEGWLHFEGRGWDALTLRRSIVNVVMVVGDTGPQVEFTTFFDDGWILTTVVSARGPAAPAVLRQCFPGDGIEALVEEHERSLRWLRQRGHAAVEVPPGDLTERLLSTDRGGGGHLRTGVIGSLLWRGTGKQRVDEGSIINRSDVLDSLRVAPPGTS